MKQFILSLCLGVMLCFGGNGIGLAATLFDEGVSGDTRQSGQPRLDLILGVNDVLGTLTPTSRFGNADFDFFTVVLPFGIQIESISLTYDEILEGEFMGATLRTFGGLSDDNFVEQFLPTGSTGIEASFLDTIPFRTGTLDRTLNGSVWEFQLLGGPILNGGKNWLTRITTSENIRPIPLPAALPLFFTGLVGLGWLKRVTRI